MPRMSSMYFRSATRSSSVRCSEVTPPGACSPSGPAVLVAMWLVVPCGRGPSAGSPRPALTWRPGPGSPVPARRSSANVPQRAAAGTGVVWGRMAGQHEVLWRKRLRWRLRGASQWPTFAVLLVADAILLHVLPIAGESQPGLVPAFLLSGFFNLVVVAALAPLVGARLRRRRPGMPKVVAEDRAGTWLLLGLAVVLAAAGVAHRPALHAARDDFADEMAAVRR